MKRTVEIELLGKKYLLACPLGAVEELERIYGNVSEFADKLAANNVGPAINALVILAKYGAKRAEQMDGEKYEVPDADFVRDNVNMEDLNTIQAKVSETITLSFANEITGKSNSKKKAKD